MLGNGNLTTLQPLGPPKAFDRIWVRPGKRSNLPSTLRSLSRQRRRLAARPTAVRFGIQLVFDRIAFLAASPDLVAYFAPQCKITRNSSNNVACSFIHFSYEVYTGLDTTVPFSKLRYFA